MDHRLAILVVAYNGEADLTRCLNAVTSHYPIVVVDNSSSRAVETVVRSQGAQYVDSGANIGFAAGVNLGLRHLPSDVDVLLLNPDAVISAAKVADLHRKLRNDPDVAAVSPRLYNDSLTEERASWPFPTPGRMWREAVGISRFFPSPEEFVTGAVLVLRREALDAVGNFDERFFLYAEETDWQRRASIQGWRVEVVGGVTARHRGAGTSETELLRESLFHAGAETYVRKWFGAQGWTSYRAAALAGSAIRIAIAPGERRAAARVRFGLYLRGPRRAAGLAPASLGSSSPVAPPLGGEVN